MQRGRIVLAAVPGIAGALLLGVSLFTRWYEPDLNAFAAFEVWDLVLLALALGSLLGLLAELGIELPGAGSLRSAVPVMAGVAVVVVASQALNHPPAAIGHAAASGQWLALAGAGLLACGAALRVSGLSLAVNFTPRTPRPRPSAPQGARSRPAPRSAPRKRSAAAESREAEPGVMGELYPEEHRLGPIGANDPELAPTPPEAES